MHRSIEDRRFGHTTRIKGYLGILAHRDSRVAAIDVDHLLTHRAGWDKDKLGFDPMFRDVEVANAMRNGALPVGTHDIFGYMMSRQWLQFTPGDQSVYSNFGFMILGHVLERANPGMTYQQIVQRDVFGPVGVTRPRIGGSVLSRRLPGEVLYHPNVPVVWNSVWSSQRPWVANQYGGFNLENMAAHGAWVMAAPDFAKVLGAFDMKEYNPILCEDTADEMVQPYDSAKWPTLARGWYLDWFPNANKVQRRVIHHNGALPGTCTVGLRRADGLSIVLFLNKDIDGLLFAGKQGRALSDIANNVTSWPTHDLFPAVGIPSFQVPCPRLSAVLRDDVPNVSSGYFELSGANLQGVTNVALGQRGINGQTQDLELGWFSRQGKDRIRVHPPQGMAAGSYSLRVRNERCWSNTLTVRIVRATARALHAPASVVAGKSFPIFAARGPSASGAQFHLAFSDSGRNSSLPGLVSLSLGAGFSRLYLWPFPVSPDPVTGAAKWTAPTLASMRGATIYFQAIVFDPRVPPPLPVTDRITVKYQ